MKATPCRLTWSAVVYQLWKQRNDMRHRNNIISEEHVLTQIKWEIRPRVTAKGRFWKTSKNVMLHNSWDISD